METFFLNELKICCADINSDRDNENGISRVIDAYKRAISFSEIARNEGLIAVEEACEGLNQSDATQKFLFKEIMLIVDGTEPKFISEMGMNMIAADKYCSYEALIMLMYYKFAVMMQEGTHPYIIGKYLQSLMPDFLSEIILKKISEQEKEKLESKKDDSDKWIKALCEDNKAIDERDYSIINQTALTLLELSDGEIQRVLREIENDDIVTAMVELPGRARARIFDNASTRLGEVLAAEVMRKGAVTFSEVEKACVNIMRTVIKLEADGEIAHHNLTVLKFVIGVYDMPNRRTGK